MSTHHAPLSVLDHFAIPNYTAISWYIPLKDDATPQDAFNALREGLRLTFRQLPWLSGKVHKMSPLSPGWRPGQLEIRHSAADLEGDLAQFHFKQLDESEAPSYDDLKDCGFPMDTFPDEDMLWGTYIKIPEEDEGAECFKAQANFFPGGVLLCGATHHNACDGTSQFDVWRQWAANCDAFQSGPASETPEPLSSDRGILERIWTAESTHQSNKNDMKPVSWTLLDMDPPSATPRPPSVVTISEEKMQSAVFYMSPDKFTALHKKCQTETGNPRISGNDALTAFIWRGLLKARHTAALASGRTPELNAEAKLQLTLDGRPDISRAGTMPLIYYGNIVFMNECTMPLSILTSPDTGVSAVAAAVRHTAEQATSQTMLDSYALAKGVQHFQELGLRLSPLTGWDMILSSLIMFPVEGMRWGGEVFGRGGEVDAIRPMWDAINGAARLCFPLPRRGGGGVEFVVNLFGDEMDLLLADGEFVEFADYLCS
ncbi:hypothetical protein OQA88_667 [Cercophora sp. LCS_1]